MITLQHQKNIKINLMRTAKFKRQLRFFFSQSNFHQSPMESWTMFLWYNFLGFCLLKWLYISCFAARNKRSSWSYARPETVKTLRHVYLQNMLTGANCLDKAASFDFQRWLSRWRTIDAGDGLSYVVVGVFFSKLESYIFWKKRRSTNVSVTLACDL